MNVSMNMMADALEDLIESRCCTEQSRRLAIAAVCPLAEGVAVSDDVLYVCDARDSASLELATQARYLVFVRGGAPKDLRPECQYAILREDVGFARGLVAAIDVFRVYGEWYARLVDELLHSRDLSRLCHIASEQLGCPVLIFDKNYAVLGNSLREDDSFVDAMLEKRSSYYVTNAESLKSMLRTPEFQETFSTHGANVYTGQTVGLPSTHSLYVNLGSESRYEGRIVAILDGRDSRPGDLEIAELFAEVVRLALRQPSLQSDDLDRIFRTYFVGMLEGRATPGRQLDDSLRLWNWIREDGYICLYAELTEMAIAVNSATYACFSLERELPGSCAIAYESGIVCAVPLKDGIELLDALQVFEKTLQPFAQGIGASSRFDDVLLVHGRLAEAQIASEYSSREAVRGPELVRFDDIALAHYHECGTSRLGATHFVDEHVRRLLEYRGQQRDYYEILKTYLELNMNLLHASEALFIHRTTLFKYLKTIRQITGADFDDVATRLRMLASFEILEMEYKRIG